MKKKIICFLSCLAMTASVLTSCGSAAGTDASSKSEGDSLTIFNYAEYLDPTLLELFTKETGITINYEEAMTPEEMYTKYTAGGISYDLLCTSDYMIKRLIDEGQAQSVEYRSMENFKNIDQQFLNLSESFDPGNKYSVPPKTLVDIP